MKKTILFLLSPLLIFAQLRNDKSALLFSDTRVATIKIYMDTAAVNWMFNHPESDSLHVCRINFFNGLINETVDSVGIRIRGNTSRKAKKKSFKLSFNEFVKGRDFYGVDKLNLNGEHNDPSIIRSKLCWDFYAKIGMNASRANHVAVYINDKYYGLYISVEHIDDEFLKKRFDDPSGNLWKCLWPADLKYLGPDPNAYKLKVGNRRVYDLRRNEDEDDYTMLAKLIEVINKTPDEKLADSLEEILVVPEVIKYFASNVLLGDWDGYRFLRNNYYLYYEPALGKFHWIPYDYDNTFGIDWFGYDWSIVNPYDYPTIDNDGRPLAEKLLNVPEYKNLFTHFLDYYSRNVFALRKWERHLDSLEKMITPFVIPDTFRKLDYGFTYSDFIKSYTAGDYYNQHVKMGIKRFVNNRNESLKEQLTYVSAKPYVYKLSVRPKFPNQTDSVRIIASAFGYPEISQITAKLFDSESNYIGEFPFVYTPDSSSTRVEENDEWQAVLPPLDRGNYNLAVVAINKNGDYAVFPRAHPLSFEISGGNSAKKVVINELLAINDNVNKDEYGEYDDWVELFNTTDSTINLSGFYLSDSKNNLKKWEFPEGSSICAHDFLLIWCDKDNQPGLHTNFKLSGGGEFVALTATDGKTVWDSISFGSQSPDVSYGRYPDGTGNFVFMNHPTPSAPNVLSTVKKPLIVSDFKLSVFPNPFWSGKSSTINIKYSFPSFANLQNTSYAYTTVSLTVYNAIGQKVATLVEKIQGRGKHLIRLNPKNLSSGVYFVRLKVGEYSKFVKIRKLVVLK